MPAMRPSLLVNVPPSEPRQSQAGFGTRLVNADFAFARILTEHPRLEDDPDDDVDDEDDFGSDDDEELDDDEGEDDDDEDTETWQVSFATRFR